MLRNNVHHIQENTFDKKKYPETGDIYNDINALSRIKAMLPQLKRGDVIVLDDYAGYRNDGKLIYDGENVVTLYYDIDDYGSTLPSFKAITEFPIDYWKGVIDHNKIVFFDTDLIKHLMKTKYLYLHGRRIVLPFVYKNKTYFITHEDYENLTPQDFLNILSSTTHFNYTFGIGDIFNSSNTLIIPESFIYDYFHTYDMN